MTNMDKLFNSYRRKDRAKPQVCDASGDNASQPQQSRTEIERDYDRILFSTPVRRMADKTQVFPLERNESIRTRLTHSHEVANLARSIGISLVHNDNQFQDVAQRYRDVPALLATIGLAHDLGNPPFGHQGENAIQSWFRDYQDTVFDDSLTEAQKRDFLKFEGNAQTLRILTRLQVINDDFGLNMTFASLAGLMKYPAPSDKVDKKNGVSYKKFGFFQSEKEIVNQIWNETGLDEGRRHPLTYIMEACDDIAYSVLDAEDAVKKGLVSYSDLITYLSHEANDDSVVSQVISYAEKKNSEHRSLGLSFSELNDISMQMFRVSAIHEMVMAVTQTFLNNEAQIMQGQLTKELIEISPAHKLRNLLKAFDKAFVYSNRAILEVELTGYNTIRRLMDIFWDAIKNGKLDGAGARPEFDSPYHRYVYSRISENYRRVFEGHSSMPIRYRQLQLITDMVSGMTDSYALALLSELEQYGPQGAIANSRS